MDESYRLNSSCRNLPRRLKKLPEPSTTTKYNLQRSFSSKNSSCSTSTSNSSYGGSPALSRSISQRTTPKSSLLLPRSVSQRSSNLGRKCSNLAKEHKARFYIIKRCVAMLVCWNKHADS